MPNSPAINFPIWIVFVEKSTINIIAFVNKNTTNKINDSNEALFIFLISTCGLFINFFAKIDLNFT